MSIQDQIEEAVEAINKTDYNHLNATAIIQGAGLIALALEKVAEAQNRAAMAQELQYKVAADMAKQVNPMVQGTLDMMKKEQEGDDWKNGIEEEDENDDEENNDGPAGGCGHRF